MKKLINSSIICIACFSGNVFGQDYLGMDYDAALEFFKRFPNKVYEDKQIDNRNYWIMERDMDSYGNLTGNDKYYLFMPDDDGKWVVVMEVAASFGIVHIKLKTIGL